jgi:hypothetical protein
MTSFAIGNFERRLILLNDGLSFGTNIQKQNENKHAPLEPKASRQRSKH